jgi:hypothetical protein
MFKFVIINKCRLLKNSFGRFVKNFEFKKFSHPSPLERGGLAYRNECEGRGEVLKKMAN